MRSLSQFRISAKASRLIAKDRLSDSAITSAAQQWSKAHWSFLAQPLRSTFVTVVHIERSYMKLQLTKLQSQITSSHHPIATDSSQTSFWKIHFSGYTSHINEHHSEPKLQLLFYKNCTERTWPWVCKRTRFVIHFAHVHQRKEHRKQNNPQLQWKIWNKRQC